MKRLLLLLLAFTCNFLFAQDLARPPQKNQLKGIIFAVPYHFFTASLSYERNFAKHSSLELTLKYAVDDPDPADAGTTYKRAFLAYRYTFLSQRRFFNNLWVSPYVRYATFESYTNYTNRSGEIYGAGCAVGKRFYFFEEQRLLIDLGYGIGPTLRDVTNLRVYNQDIREFEQRPSYQYQYLKSRLIFLMGFNF